MADPDLTRGGAAGPWQPMSTAPKDGSDILICMPGGHSDHFNVMAWDESEGAPAWRCRSFLEHVITEEELAACHIAPMWTWLYSPPGSLVAGRASG